MTDDFIKAFNHTMNFEIGPHYDSCDVAVIEGKIETPSQCKKVGFTNIAGDRGGVTKYGIAQNAHPTISVKDLNLQQAMEIYEKQYWLAGKCDKIPGIVGMLHFDACVNHGLKAATKFLQRALAIEDDGVLGSQTLAAVLSMDAITLAKGMLSTRETFFHRIVANDPVQKKFLKGWLSRINNLRAWAKLT